MNFWVSICQGRGAGGKGTAIRDRFIHQGEIVQLNIYPDDDRPEMHLHLTAIIHGGFLSLARNLQIFYSSILKVVQPTVDCYRVFWSLCSVLRGEDVINWKAHGTAMIKLYSLV